MNLDWKYSDETNSELMLSTFGRYLLKIGYNSLRGWNDFPEWGENEIVKVDSIASCNLLLSKKDFAAINGYDENFPFSGAEDFDFSERLKSLNVPMYIDLSSFTIHNELDHLTFKKWLFRQFRGGITKRIAFDITMIHLLQIAQGRRKGKTNKQMIATNKMHACTKMR